MLHKIDLTEDALACGPHPPMHAPSAEAMRDAGLPPSRIHNNCSGKHSGLLAFTTGQRWETRGYHEASHPTQQRILSTLSKWMGVAEGDIDQAVDGCGLPTYAMPLDAVAEGCAKFAAAAASGVTAPAQIFSAMRGHPEFVAGTGRLCTDVMRAAKGRLFAKVGAEGFYCAGVPSMKLGIALKVEDGATRASEPALLAILKTLDAISSDELAYLTRYAEPVILNTRGETVGLIRALVKL
jgi:L-asparaginase II